ncbi:zinc-binding dehydrogenase [Streptomyces sp. M19]
MGPGRPGDAPGPADPPLRRLADHRPRPAARRQGARPEARRRLRPGPGRRRDPRPRQGDHQGRGLDAAFDCVGRAPAFQQAQSVLAHRGRLVLVGISPDTLAVGPERHVVRQRQSVIGHTGYRMDHIEDLVELASRGRLDVSGSVSAVLPLEEVNEGVRRLREHEGNPIRVLLRP